MQIKIATSQTQPTRDHNPVTPPATDPHANVDKHGQGFCDFLNAAPTVFHTVGYYSKKLDKEGFKGISERDDWSDILKPGGKYYFTRNYSSLIAFTIGKNYVAGNGVALIGSHIDAITMRVKPVSTKSAVGYLQLGVAPYANRGAATWWDRDLGLGGRVMVSDEAGDIKQMLVRLPYPVAKIPTLAPHFGAAAQGPFDAETQMTPIIGLESTTVEAELEKQFNVMSTDNAIHDTVKNHSPRLLNAVAKQLGVKASDIKDFDLELFDHQQAQPFGLDAELLSVPRCDDKLCSYAAMEALSSISSDSAHVADSGIVSMVFLSDDEEVGSRLRQGAAGNMVPITVERITDSLNRSDKRTQNLVAMAYAKSFLVSADVIHAVNPNFVSAYEPNMMPRLNVGPILSCDANANMTTDAASKALMQRIADKSGSKLQLFQIRNGQPSGGTIGPMLSSATGMRAADVGIPQLAMHSIRATTGSEDPGLGVKFFEAFFRHFEAVESTIKVD